MDGGGGRVRVLVTGGSSGIGAATARALARRGVDVVVHGRDPRATARVAGEVGGTALVADLSTPDGVREIADGVGEIDGLVHNAGVGWAGPLTAMAGADVVRLVRTNLVAPIELTRVLLPRLAERPSGRIVFVTSIAGRVGVAGEAVYAATKAGLDAFAESLRFELAGTSTTVSVVIPGVVDTPFFARRGAPYARKSPKAVPPERVAAAIVTAITSGRAEAYVPRWLRLATGVRAVVPGAYRALATRFGGQGGTRAT